MSIFLFRMTFLLKLTSFPRNCVAQSTFQRKARNLIRGRDWVASPLNRIIRFRIFFSSALLFE